MDKKSLIFLVLGIAISIILFIFNIYLAGIVFILVITLFMSMFIMQDSKFHPDVEVTLSEDAKSIILKNSGNSAALHIHVALVPFNTEFDIAQLAVDESHSRSFETMIQEVKVLITFENDENNEFKKTVSLSALGNAYDPLKPMIPMFKWK
jgi:c-di-AMP phosphodiesterase-like protein